MTFSRYQTDKRLWLWVSLVLFVAPWFLVPIGKSDEWRPAILWLFLFTEPHHLLEVVGGIVMFSLLFAIPACAVGWVVQCLIVIVRSTWKHRAHHDA